MSAVSDSTTFIPDSQSILTQPSQSITIASPILSTTRVPPLANISTEIPIQQSAHD